MQQTGPVTAVRLDGSTLPAREEVGNKAHSLARMRGLGLPVPPAFVLPVAVGRRFTAEGALPDDVWQGVLAALADLEAETGRRLGDPESPLLLSVRSGAAESMPGMMDTVLNLGVDDVVEEGLARLSGDPAFARDVHRRFLRGYAALVLGVEPAVAADADPPGIRAAIAAAGHTVPHDPRDALQAAVRTIFGSWNSRRAIAYREHHGIAHDGGTAVTVQAMVFGNLDDASGTGVLFSRDPQSGAAEPMGEFLPRGQGEDVVSGEVDPLDLASLRERMPAVASELVAAAERLEREAGDVQDIEFTVEEGRLFLLQTRTAKRAPRAALRIAVDLVDEGVLTPAQALARVTAEHVGAVLRPVVDPEVRASATVLARGLPACPGVAVGRVVTDPDVAVLEGDDEDPVVLARRSTSPEDLQGMIASAALCTEVGGRTSHAAVVGRELGLPCVVGCGEGVLLALDGQDVTVDGTSGEVLAGRLPVVAPRADEDPDLARLVAWAREHPDALPSTHPVRTAAGS